MFKRLTDVRGFTGSHRFRFDDSGKGRGLFGRDRLEQDHIVPSGKAAPPVPFLSPRDVRKR